MGGGERGAAGGDAGVAAGAGGGDGDRVEWAFDEHRAGAADQGVAGGVGTEPWHLLTATQGEDDGVVVSR